MKLISKRLASNWKGELVRREFELWKEINSHHFIVKLHYCFSTETTFNFVMDLCPGGTLLSLLRIRVCLPVRTSMIYFLELMVIFENMHNNNIIYRDLKAENILLDELGHICLTDFGLARRMVDSHRNENMSFCGSPIYIAPETLQKKEYSKKVDFYALGVLLFEMITGQPPFYHKKSTEIKRMKVENEVEYPSVMNPKVREIIEKCISKVSFCLTRILNTELTILAGTIKKSKMVFILM